MYSVVGIDGQVYGPVDIDVLKQWCIEGRIVGQTNLIDAISGQIIPAKDVIGLGEMFQTPPIAPSAPPMAAAPPPANVAGPQPFQPTYGYAQNYPAVYEEPKQKVIAGVLGIVFGSLGVHRFYLGYNGMGIAMLLITILTCGWGGIITSIWGLIEGIMCLTGSMTDAQGRPLV